MQDHCIFLASLVARLLAFGIGHLGRTSDVVGGRGGQHNWLFSRICVDLGIHAGSTPSLAAYTATAAKVSELQGRLNGSGSGLCSVFNSGLVGEGWDGVPPPGSGWGGVGRCGVGWLVGLRVKQVRGVARTPKPNLNPPALSQRRQNPKPNTNHAPKLHAPLSQEQQHMNPSPNPNPSLPALPGSQEKLGPLVRNEPESEPKPSIRGWGANR